MSGFKVGDLVVPLDITTRCDLSINKTYRITKIDGYGYVRVKNNSGLEPWYSPTRFKLAENNMNISDLVDISETHGDMIPRADIDYFRHEESTASFGLTKDYHTQHTIKTYLERGIRHFCRPENVPPTAISPPTLPKGYEWTQDPPEYRMPKNGDEYLYNKRAVIALGNNASYKTPEWIVRKITKAMDTSPIKLEVGKTYLTEGNYLVHIAGLNPSTNRYFTTIECSPGIDGAGLSINEFLKSANCKRSYNFKKYGWAYEPNGDIHFGTPNEWTKKLKIVKELPFSLPPAPVGYQYAGGFPQFRVPKNGEYFLSAYSGVPDKEYSAGKNVVLATSSVNSTPRLILEQVAAATPLEIKPNNYYITEGGYVVALNEQLVSQWPMPGGYNNTFRNWRWEKDGSIKNLINQEWCDKLRIKGILQVEFPKQLPDGYQWKDGVPQFRLPKNGEEYYRGLYSVVTAYGDHSKGSYSQFILERVVATPPVEKYPKYYESGDNTVYAFRKKIDANTYRLVELDGTEHGYYKWENRGPHVPTIEITEDEALGRIVAATTPTPQVKTSLSASTQNLIDNPPKITNLCKEVGPPVKTPSLLGYWVTEPAHNSYTAVKKSVRYIVLWSVISGIGYTAYDPTGVASFVKSCLPKITVRYENEKVDG